MLLHQLRFMNISRQPDEDTKKLSFGKRNVALILDLSQKPDANFGIRPLALHFDAVYDLPI